MKNRASIFGAGMGIVTVALVYGVLANSVVTEKFAQSIPANNVLGVSNENTAQSEFYGVSILGTKIYDSNEATQTKRVSIHVSVKNSTPETLELSPGLNFNLLDTDDAIYPYTAEFLAENEIVGGPIITGQALDLTLDFVIPAMSTPANLEMAVSAQSPYRIRL